MDEDECKNCGEPLTDANRGTSGTRCLECEAFLHALAANMQAHPEKFGVEPGSAIVMPWDAKPHG